MLKCELQQVSKTLENMLNIFSNKLKDFTVH